MKGDLFSSEHMVQPATAPGMTVENSKCIRYTVNGEMLARQGAMVAYRGNLQFERKGQGVGGMLKRAVTGEGLPLMAVRGQGEAWFAHEAQNCFVVDVEPGDEFTVNGRNVLCFDASLAYRIATVKGAGIDRRRPVQQRLHGARQARAGVRGQPAGDPGLAGVPGVRRHGRGRRLDRGPADLAAPFAVHRVDAARRFRRGGAADAPGPGYVVVRPSEATPQKAQQH